MKVPVSGQVTGDREVENILQVARSQHYGGGVWTRLFERQFADFMGRRFSVLCNSGSSANLLALSALELQKGSTVLTCAVNFPTTVNAILQLGLVPVFVDADPKTLNAVIPDGWEGDAMVVAHTLGNPANIPETSVPVIEDCCDAIGGPVGKRGVMATASFYPAHHITMGEGGSVLTDSPRLKKVLESYRDWGRDCWCEPGEDNTCGKRFDGDYDHKYTYSRIGYNLKASDFQAAAGVAQLERLQGFIEARRRNWLRLREGFSDLPIEIVEMPADASPFGFAFLTDRRNELARHLDSLGVGNRPIMGGNLLRQPAYHNINCHTLGSLDGANRIHEQGLWVGCFPGLSDEQLDYSIEVTRGYYKGSGDGRYGVRGLVHAEDAAQRTQVSVPEP